MRCQPFATRRAPLLVLILPSSLVSPASTSRPSALMPPDKPRRSTWLPFTLLATAALLTIASSPTVAAAAPPSDPAFIREPGRCAMRDTCGSKSIFSGQLPCPDNGLAKAVRSPCSLLPCTRPQLIVTHAHSLLNSNRTTTPSSSLPWPTCAVPTFLRPLAAPKDNSRCSQTRWPRPNPSLQLVRSSGPLRSFALPYRSPEFASKQVQHVAPTFVTSTAPSLAL